MDNQTVLRFAVMSDTHYSETHPVVRERFARAMEAIRRCADADDYKTLDALYVVGDFTDTSTAAQMEMFRTDAEAFLPAETKLVILLANHDMHYVPDNRAAMADFERIFGMARDRHEVIRGYHFISVSGIRGADGWDDSFDEAKQAFAREALAQARADGGNRPIFFFQHTGFPGTIAGGDFGRLELFSILKDYPQVIDFSGHSHQSANSPREIDQNYFTCVGTGSMYSLSARTGRVHHDYDLSSWNGKDYGQMLLVEVSADDAVRIRCLDAQAGGFYDDGIVLRDVWDPARHTCTDRRAALAKPPVFPEGASVTAVREAEGLRLTFPQAHGIGERVQDYRVTVSDAAGVVLAQRTFPSDYPALRPCEIFSVFLSGTYPDGCTVRVYAEGFWDNLSAPIGGILS